MKWLLPIFLLITLSFGMSKEEAQKYIVEYGCVGCHSFNKKVVGPAYRWIAQRYRQEYSKNPEEVLNRLLNHVLKGTVGNWGDVPMPPQPVPAEKEKEFIRFILENL